MRPRPRNPAGRPYWLLVPFALLMVAPGWATAALIAAALAVSAARAGRHMAARRTVARRAAHAISLGTGSDGRPVLLDDGQLAAHGLIVGASGAGKSTTLLTIVCDQVRRGRPVVVIDLKGSPEFARRLADAASQAGREFRVWTPDGPSHWNPLQHGNATELKDKLISAERFTEPHYQRAAERYVQTVLQVLEHVDPGRPPTLEEVVRLMDPQRLAGTLRGHPGPLSERVHDYLAGMTPDQLSAVRGLGTRLAIVTESHMGKHLGPGGRGATIDLHHALNGDGVVLFSLNSSSYGKLAAQIGTLVIQDLVAAVGARLAHGPGSERAIVAVDEFSALGGDQVMALLARSREAGVSVLLATQELADLDRAAPGLRDQVLGNTAIKIAHRQDVPSSAHTVAQMAGTERVWEETRQIGGGLLGGYASGRGTRRVVEQFVVHPNEIKTLRTGEAVMITKLPRSKVQTVRVSAPPRHAARRDRDGPELG